MPAPANPNLAHLFLDQRIEQGQGERVALYFEDQAWSYREVQALSLHYAESLRAAGLKPQQRALIALRDGPDWVAYFFAILRLGAVVVMANPRLSSAGLAELAAYTGARVLVQESNATGSEAQEIIDTAYLKQGHSPPRYLHPHRPEPATQAAKLECALVQGSQSAIWLFSGGTTGNPKAVMQSHDSFAYTTRMYAHEVLGIRAQDITVSVPKLYFGYATGSNLLFPFSVGASCVLFKEPSSAPIIAALVQKHRATLLIHVPTMVARMLEDPSIAPAQLQSLRLATSAGEALPASVHQRWQERFGIELLDGLGTAEMWHIFLSNRPGHVRPGSLGQVVPGFEIRLCDDDGQEVPRGQSGWMRVRGGAKALGYWNRPEQDQSAFADNWYLSGDRLRQDEEGYFYYCGRSGDLMKVSGKWLAPADVENALISHPKVASAVVVGAADPHGLQKPYAFITLSKTGQAGWSESELQNYVASSLEPYKAPRRIFAAESWPRTHLGKADRKRLREMVSELRGNS